MPWIAAAVKRDATTGAENVAPPSVERVASISSAPSPSPWSSSPTKTLNTRTSVPSGSTSGCAPLYSIPRGGTGELATGTPHVAPPSVEVAVRSSPDGTWKYDR